MKKLLCSVAVLALAGTASTFAFNPNDYAWLIDQMQNCPIKTDADILAKAKSLADDACASHSCTSFNYSYQLCDQFDVTCEHCDPA